jgi:hypothetical protein
MTGAEKRFFRASESGIEPMTLCTAKEVNQIKLILRYPLAVDEIADSSSFPVFCLKEGMRFHGIRTQRLYGNQRQPLQLVRYAFP